MSYAKDSSKYAFQLSTGTILGQTTLDMSKSEEQSMSGNSYPRLVYNIEPSLAMPLLVGNSRTTNHERSSFEAGQGIGLSPVGRGAFLI